MSKNENQVAVKAIEDDLDYNWSEYCIMIAEDEETNFVYLETALLKTKVQIIRAKNGQEAVDLAKINPQLCLILANPYGLTVGRIVSLGRQINSVSLEGLVISKKPKNIR